MEKVSTEGCREERSDVRVGLPSCW